MSKKDGKNQLPPKSRVIGRGPNGNYIEVYDDGGGFYGGKPTRSAAPRRVIGRDRDDNLRWFDDPNPAPPPRSRESVLPDPFEEALFTLTGAMGGASTDELADAINRRGHGSVAASSQLPIQGSPGYRNCGQYRGQVPVVLDGAEERLAILKSWLVNPDLPREDKGRVEYQIQALSEDIESARVWKAMGVEFGETVDSLFRKAKLPVGWKLVRTDHAMYSDLVDEQGRQRASMFSKMSFGDTDAFIGVRRRFSVWRDYDAKDQIRVRVLDVKKEVFAADPIPLVEPEGHGAEYSAYIKRREEIEAELRAVCIKWLDEHYPQHNDTAAHWDDP